MLFVIKDKFHKKLRSFIENNRHIIELSLDIFHFFVLPPLIIYCSYYSYWWWNTNFIEHSTYVDIQFSLRGNTVSVNKNLKHDKKYYWLYEVDWPNRLIDIYQLDKEYKVFRKRSRYIYRFERPDLICKQSEAWKLVKHSIDGKGLPVKFRNYFYREYCQNVHHYIREKNKISNKFLNFSKNLKTINDSFNLEKNKNLNKLNYKDLICNKKNKFYNSFFLKNHYLDYKKSFILFKSWNYDRYQFNKMINKNFGKNVFYSESNIFFKKKVKKNFFNLYLKNFKINKCMINSFFLNNSKNYNKLIKLKMCCNNENFFAPFDFEIKYSEYSKYKIDYDLYKKLRSNIIKKLKFHIYNNQSSWKQYYLNYLNFKSKKKLLLESRLRNRLYQQKLFYWSSSKRVPYKFKHDNLLSNKTFKTRSHYFDDYFVINKKRKKLTNSLSITNWANNYRSNYRFMQQWYKNNDQNYWVKRRIRGRLRYYKPSYSWNKHYYNIYLKENYFFLAQVLKKRYRTYYGIFEHRTAPTYTRFIARNALNISENLYEHAYTPNSSENQFKQNVKWNDCYDINTNYKKDSILKTELNYSREENLFPKKKNLYLTDFPLRQKQNANVIFEKKSPYERVKKSPYDKYRKFFKR